MTHHMHNRSAAQLRFIVLGTLFAIGIFMLWPAPQHQATANGDEKNAPSQVTLTTALGQSHVVAVEVADTPETQRRGLMFRQELAPDAGMLFVFDKPRETRFWMRDTYIPLDMVFADATGKIIYIHENAIPHDLTHVGPEGDTVQFVLEINAGTAKRLGLRVGDTLSWTR